MVVPTLVKSPVVFNEEEHRYFLGDKELKGITSSLIRRAFPDKYKDIDPEVLANAARKGKELHEAIEFFDNFGGNPEDATDDRIMAYADLKYRMGLETIANEYLVSDEENYASSIDIVMVNNKEEICLIDTKTTYYLDKSSTGLQLSIYKYLFEMQNKGLVVSHIYVLWLPNRDHGICELHELSIVDEDVIKELIDAEQNDKPFVFNKIPDEWHDLESLYNYWYETKEQAENAIADIKSKMEHILISNNINMVKTGNYTVSYIPSKSSKRFDSSLFKKENKSLYDSYTRDVIMPSQVRIIQKKKEV